MTLRELYEILEYGTPVKVLKINKTSGFAEDVDANDVMECEVVRIAINIQQLRVVVRKVVA